jgi:hypothetical protein
MTTAEGTTLVGWAWDEQSIWSKTADRIRRNQQRARVITLALTAVAAALVTVAAQVQLLADSKQLFALGACVCTTLVALSQTFIGPGKVQERLRTRSVSESLKSAIYTYLAGTAPFSGAGRDTLLRKAIDAILGDAADLSDRVIGVQPDARPIPPVHDVDSYVAIRLQGQMTKYYQPKSLLMKRRAQIFRIAETALAGVAAVLSGTTAATQSNSWVAWLPVLTTVGGAFAAEAAFQRYSVLAVEYARASAELGRLLRDRRSGAAEGDALVAAAERVISQQNEAWMARGLAVAETLVTLPAPSKAKPDAA